MKNKEQTELKFNFTARLMEIKSICYEGACDLLHSIVTPALQMFPEHIRVHPPATAARSVSTAAAQSNALIKPHAGKVRHREKACLE